MAAGPSPRQRLHERRPLNPMEAVLLSMLLEHEKRIAELEQALEAGSAGADGPPGE